MRETPLHDSVFVRIWPKIACQQRLATLGHLREGKSPRPAKKYSKIAPRFGKVANKLANSFAHHYATFRQRPPKRLKHCGILLEAESVLFRKLRPCGRDLGLLAGR
jgi:hypothetical protein